MKITVIGERERKEILSSWPVAEQHGNEIIIDANHDYELVKWFQNHLDNFLLIREEDGLGVFYETKDVLACTKAFRRVLEGDDFTFIESFDTIVRYDTYDFDHVSVGFYTPWWLDLVHNYLELKVHEGRYLLCNINGCCDSCSTH